MLKSHIILTLLFLALCFTAPAFAEEEATMHQVYLAAESGKFNEAQPMIDEVFHDHPDSAKAHFVEAELPAKQGLFGNAGVELISVERMQPGLPFAKPEALQNNLKTRIYFASNGVMQPNIARQSKLSTITNWMPSTLLILNIGLIVLSIGFMRRRNSRMTPANNYVGNTPFPNMLPVGARGVGSVMGQPTTSGTGSGIMGSLAKRAVLGVGVVAGKVLMSCLIYGNKNNVISEPPSQDTSRNTSGTDDMGGADFGIADASSWEEAWANVGGDGWI